MPGRRLAHTSQRRVTPEEDRCPTPHPRCRREHRPARRFPIDAVSRRLPAITRPRVEFAANVALFVPFGVLLPLILRRSLELVLPIALVATVTIECGQALLLSHRVPSVLDIVANVTGASIGMLVLALWRRMRRA